jgi:hypothetical protein
MSGISENIDGVDRSKIFGRVLWNDINMPANALTLGAAAPDSIGILGAGGIKGLGFDGNATAESLHGSAEILHGYLEGSDIYFHVHWMPTTANAGDVKWQLEYSWQTVDGTFANPTIISIVDAAGGAAWKHQLAPFAAIDGSGMGVNSAVVFRLFRDPTDGDDDYADDAALIQVGIHYQIDVYGSRSQTVK